MSGKPKSPQPDNEIQVLVLRLGAIAAAEGWWAGCDASDCPYSNFLVPLRDA